MIPALFRSAVPAVVALCLGATTVMAQSSSNATDNSKDAGRQTVAETAELPSLQGDAIRVPAMGMSMDTAAEANASAAETDAARPKKARAAAPRPKKRARVARRFHEGEAVYVRPHHYYAPRPYYRIGRGIGPGFVYAW